MSQSKQLLIKNARIVSSGAIFTSDILCENGLITKVAPCIEGDFERCIDAADNIVTPGGIDAHVHLNLSTANGTIADNFYEGSLAALAGGTTTFIDFITPGRNETLEEATVKRISEAENAVTDYAFHGSITSWQNDTPEQMEACFNKYGISTYKVYMAYKNNIGIGDEVLVRTLDATRAQGMLTLVHCENGDTIDFLQTQALSNGQTEAINHALTRPPETEGEAINRLLMMAQAVDAPVFVVHVSTKQGARLIKKARKNKRPVYAETCPHYLFLTDEALKAGEHPFAYIMSPPLRSKKDVRYLRKALASCALDVISTDHCSYMLNDKTNRPDFTKVPNGVAGIETRLSLMFSHGPAWGLSLQMLVALTSENPARLNGLWPRKGVILEGSDADIVIWKKTDEKLSNAMLHHKSDHTVFEGLPLRLVPQTVVCRGVVAYDNGAFFTENIKGRYLKREKPLLY